MKKLLASSLALLALFAFAPSAHASYQLTPKSTAIPLKTATYTVGTWTYTNASGIEYELHTTAADTSVLQFPISNLRRSDGVGLRIDSIDVYYRASTANFSSAPTAVLYSMNAGKAVVGGGTNIDATTITTSTNASVTAAATDQKMTFTVSSPTFDYSSANPYTDYEFDLTLPAAASTVLRVYKVVVNYTEAI